MEHLSPSQRDAVNQLQALTNGGDVDVTIDVLESVNWDVQRAAEVVFDGPSAATTSVRASSSSNIEEFELDDSEQGLLSGRPGRREFRRVNQPSPSMILSRPFRALLTFITFPLQLISSLLRFLFRVLHIPFPQFRISLSSPFSGLSFPYRPLGPNTRDRRSRLDPKASAERWVLTLEEETGAACLGRSRRHAPSDAEGSCSTGAVGSSTSITARATSHEVDAEADSGSKVLPNFFIGSYEDFARACLKDARIGCVVLVSDEHDDVAEFKRSTLTDPELVHLMHENNFLVWGGEIRDQDAWGASQKLQATTYPFVAFIALQPRRAPGASSTSSPTLTILSRHQGPCIPSATAPTSASSLTAHLKDHVLPRISPFLVRIRAQAAERERERALRAEQDAAFEESKRADRERIERRMAEERRALEERRELGEATKRADEERRAEEERRKLWEDRRMEWRRWGRRMLVPREPRPGVVEPARGKTMRVGVRLPDGRRAVRFFGEGDGVTALYAWVDALYIPAEYSQEKDPQQPPHGRSEGEAGVIEEITHSGKLADQWWGFKLAVAFPRREVGWEASKRLGDVEALKGGGQVVVESVVDANVNGATKAKGKEVKSEDDSDGYETESD